MGLTKIKFCIFYFFYLIISISILLEIVSRILPTSTPLFLAPVLDSKEILKYYPNQSTKYSLGGNFYKIVEKSTNNYGFFSTFDYQKNSKPNLMIIGDSFVEAVQIKNEDSIGEVIVKNNPKLSVYQMGVGGIAMSQYIKMLQYAEREFSPENYIFVLVANDFDESICSLRVKEGTWCFNDDHELKFFPFIGYSKKRRLMRNLAFARYLVFNLKVEWRPLAAKLGIRDPAMKADREFAGNTERFKSDEIYKKSIKVVESFFNELKKLNVADKTTLIIAADHNDIYAGKKTNSYFRDIREILIDKANIHNVSYIDLAKIFESDYRRFKKKFDFPTDGHWNEYAHELAAKAFLSLKKID